MPLSHSSRYARLTSVQLRLFGGVVAEWSNVEFLVETILVRLAQAPDFLGLALTNDLNITRRIAALKNLVTIARQRYHPPKISAATEKLIAQAISELNDLKDFRNKIVHYCWCRQTDTKVFGVRFRGKLADHRNPNANCEVLSNAELKARLDRIRKLVKLLMKIHSAVPQVNE